ncbi:hypothetical protein DRO51_03430 [Candidatus Bathyarchaeota archaeon]|nr:MAG: hypothetical protein DRO51_03430 [Candidatus Bathyarchaeota archaeon]
MLRFEGEFKDRDYIQTIENLFFCVVGYVHPPGRVISYLKYIPRNNLKGGYERILAFYTIPNIEKTLTYLEKNYPKYIIYDNKTYGSKFSSVPLSSIKLHLRPEERVSEIIAQDKKLDYLESKALKFILKLSEVSGVPTKFFGITGSILLKIHNPDFSDIDITVYGLENSLKVKEAVLDMYEDPSSGLSKFTGKLLRDWCNDKAKLYPLTVKEAEELYRRIWNRGIFEEKMFSIHPTRLSNEIREKYGEKIIHQKDLVDVDVKILDAEESIFMPSTYKVEETICRSPKIKVDIDELVSYEGLYCGIFSEGEWVSVRGVLEEVEDKRKGKSYFRVVVGSLKAKGKDYIKPKS